MPARTVAANMSVGTHHWSAPVRAARHEITHPASSPQTLVAANSPIALQPAHLGIPQTPPLLPLPPYRHTPLFPPGKDTTPYRKLTTEGVRVETELGKEVVVVAREALRPLAEPAFADINHLLRPGHLKQLRTILDDPEASANDKFVAFDFLKNANIAAGGVLPMCQDTGTAIIMGKKGRRGLDRWRRRRLRSPRVRATPT